MLCTNVSFIKIKLKTVLKSLWSKIQYWPLMFLKLKVLFSIVTLRLWKPVAAWAQVRGTWMRGFLLLIFSYIILFKISSITSQFLPPLRRKTGLMKIERGLTKWSFLVLQGQGRKKEAFSHKHPACCVGKLHAQRGMLAKQPWQGTCWG